MAKLTATGVRNAGAAAKSYKLADGGGNASIGARKSLDRRDNMSLEERRLFRLFNPDVPSYLVERLEHVVPQPHRVLSPHPLTPLCDIAKLWSLIHEAKGEKVLTLRDLAILSYVGKTLIASDGINNRLDFDNIKWWLV